MRRRETLEQLTQRLAEAGLEDPQLESRFLMQSVLQLSWSDLLRRPEHELMPADAARLASYAEERMSGQPLAYVTGHQPFGELDLVVSPAVLIPRPETEALVEKVLDSLERSDRALTLADVGTGSGNIALSLARHRRVRRVYGIDLSLAALKIARQNAQRYDGLGKCEWRHGDLLSGLGASEGIDGLVANLPYIRSADVRTLSREVQNEPLLALDGGPTGLGLIFRLIEEAGRRLAVGGELWLEVGYDQAQAVSARLASDPWGEAAVHNDLSGIPRIVHARIRGR